MSDPRTPKPRQDVETAAAQRSEKSDIEAFVAKARALAVGSTGDGRLILALDATMSRQPTWDLACGLQSEMFEAAGKSGKLGIQLVYFRGLGECRASKFVADTKSLRNLMSGLECQGGHTQIGKVLSHALKETARKKVNAVVFIGDAMEEELEGLAAKAGQLGLHGVPIFVFQEGHDAGVETAFRQLARLSKGAWFRFDRSAAATLARLLASIAVYAAGGLKALEARGTQEDRLMIEHLRGPAR